MRQIKPLFKEQNVKQTYRFVWAIFIFDKTKADRKFKQKPQKLSGQIKNKQMESIKKNKKFFIRYWFKLIQNV